MKKNEKITYKKAGVNIDEGERFVDLIKPMVRKTFRPGVMTDIGSFGAFFKLDVSKYKNPVLVSGTDGVGTKLKIAFMADRHDTVGTDLVAMCVNDILTSGAEPLFFLDYFASGKLKPEKASDVVKGITDGCIEAGCALVGGETAEMPGFYDKGEYDLSGFAVGVVEKDRIIDGSKIKDGDSVIGIASNGVHSNGYSLVRKVLFDAHHFSINKRFPELGVSLGEELLRPTHIYVRAVLSLLKKIQVKGMAHITGGGLPGNLPRIFHGNLGAVIFENSWPAEPVFDLIMRLGSVPLDDMRRTFNMGIGYVLVVNETDTDRVLSLLGKSGYEAYLIGVMSKKIKGIKYAKI
ncbi:MAG: phosphoribosylformylglycinamidine cyclo-ligase [Nitrospirae bacterium]|nr:phosphoribosylformylglycinamidine cyclo-ligase [Nitrospirota bacterium]